MALVDTNCDPDPIDYVIACNDDTLKGIKLILDALGDEIIQRKSDMRSYASKEAAGGELQALSDAGVGEEAFLQKKFESEAT